MARAKQRCCWPRQIAAIEARPSLRRPGCVASAPAPSSSSTSPASPELRPARSTQTATRHKLPILIQICTYKRRSNKKQPTLTTSYVTASPAGMAPPPTGHVHVLTNQRWAGLTFYASQSVITVICIPRDRLKRNAKCFFGGGRNVVKRGNCYQHVFPSVCPSVRLDIMQTNTAVEQNKNIKLSESPSGIRSWRKGFVEDGQEARGIIYMSKFRMKDWMNE